MFKNIGYTVERNEDSMNIRNNKGITFVTLVISIILLMILAGTSVYVGLNISETAKLENIKTNLISLQGKCKIIAEKNAIEEGELYGTKQESGEYKGWYLLSKADLVKMGLNNLDDKDNYYVDYENDDVAYGNGITYKDVTYHKLSEIKGVE